jgi:hypothetical protein
MEFDFLGTVGPNELPETPKIWPASEWGQTIYSGNATSADHIKLRVRKCVEGVLTVVHCTKCGGLEQHIADLGGAYNAFHTGDKETSRRLMREWMPEAQVNEFVVRHTDCAVTPMEHHFPEEVRLFTDFMLEKATETLANGEDGSGMAHVLTSDGTVLRIDIGSLPPGESGLRTEAIQFVHWAVRSMMRRFDLDPLAVSFVTEAWASADLEHGRPATASDRYEVLVVTVMTQSSACTGLGRIVREGGTQDEGPGHFEGFDWTGKADEHYLLEGLLAT